jgi:DNA-binding MarR family transcriptional regulator
MRTFLVEMSPEIAQPQLDAWRSLLNAHAAMVDRVERDLAAAGLPQLAWYDVLWPLYEAPGRKLRMRELSERVVTISRSGLTRLVDRIEAAGMLRRQPTPEDRRGTEIVITRAGERLLRKMWPVYAAAIDEHFASKLPDRDAKTVRESLERVRASARRGD